MRWESLICCGWCDVMELLPDWEAEIPSSVRLYFLGKWQDRTVDLVPAKVFKH